MRAWVEFDHTVRNPNSGGASCHGAQEVGNPPHSSRRVRTGGYRHGDY
ncbi:hypothetical protein MUK42_30068 [Musa troglodytarum]|uniref:Uncharacterized protein n=1 Tax=Musa troglodytarum TaxID=320322 RepID=A0A9E7FIN5_9LILI|nr:hypothetical protein MUK42_30068 [Musa troglodytarum]